MTFQKRFAVIILVLTAFTSRSFAQGEQESEKPAEAKTVALQKLPSSLEEMLGRALGSNPDIQVAEADIHHAHAKVKQIRMKVSHALVGAFLHRNLRREALEIAKSKYTNMKILVEAGRTDSESLFTHRQALTLAEAALVETESMIRGLVGMDPSSGKTPDLLEKTLTMAFQSNGEIALAKADLIRMDARSNQIRLKVTEEVTITYQTRRSKMNALVIVKKVYQRAQERVEQGLLREDEKLTAFQAVIESEAELIRAEAHLRYLLGLGGTVHSREKSQSKSVPPK